MTSQHVRTLYLPKKIKALDFQGGKSSSCSSVAFVLRLSYPESLLRDGDISEIIGNISEVNGDISDEFRQTRLYWC